jgi:hypothetical protein
MITRTQSFSWRCASRSGIRLHGPLDQRQIHHALNVETGVQFSHGLPGYSWLHRLRVRIRGFHPREQGPSPCGAALPDVVKRHHVPLIRASLPAGTGRRDGGGCGKRRREGCRRQAQGGAPGPQGRRQAAQRADSFCPEAFRQEAASSRGEPRGRKTVNRLTG